MRLRRRMFLPNNKNIIMAAEQAIKLADRNVCVLPSRTVPQGIAAMLAFDPDAELEQNQVNMSNALDTVSTGSITFAARDSDYDGHAIREGELLALDNGKLSFTDTDLARTCSKLVKQMLSRSSSFVTVYYGEDVTPEMAAQAEGAIRQRLPEDVELTVLNGGQPVYYFIIWEQSICFAGSLVKKQPAWEIKNGFPWRAFRVHTVVGLSIRAFAAQSIRLLPQKIEIFAGIA